MIEKLWSHPERQPYLLSESLTAARFALMVELFEEDGVRGARRYLDHLKMGTRSGWMAPIPGTQPGLPPRDQNVGRLST